MSPLFSDDGKPKLPSILNAFTLAGLRAQRERLLRAAVNEAYNAWVSVDRSRKPRIVTFGNAEQLAKGLNRDGLRHVYARYVAFKMEQPTPQKPPWDQPSEDEIKGCAAWLMMKESKGEKGGGGDFTEPIFWVCF